MRGGGVRILLLGGTQEARRIAVALAREPFVNITVALQQPDRVPQSYGWPLRIGNWGGEGQFRAFLETEGFEAVIDATHPFAEGITSRASRICDELGLHYLQFLRPAWIPSENDRWEFLNDETDAALHIPAGQTVFLSTGRHRLEQFSGLADNKLYCRVREYVREPFPYPNGRYLLQPGPFSVADEVALFRALGVTWVVARNSGGQGSWPKIEAARELGLPVAMIRRPKQSEGLKIATVAETLAWVRRRL